MITHKYLRGVRAKEYGRQTEVINTSALLEILNKINWISMCCLEINCVSAVTQLSFPVFNSIY